MRRSIKAIACCLVVTTFVSFMAACGNDSDDGSNDKITLEEPVGVSAEYDVVAERNMYSVDVYSSSVNPVVTEYSFSKDQTFKKYGATPGSTVKAGDELAYSQTKSMDKQITELSEELADFESDYAITIDNLNKDIEDAKKAEYKAAEPYMEIVKFKPEENSDAYAGWAAMALLPEGIYARAVQNRERLEQNLKQTKELHELEYQYKVNKLENIKSKVTDATIIADVDGEIVAGNFFEDGDWIEKETPILAVGDISQRVLQTEYISKGNVNKALDIYAIINGKRYELQYVNMDPEEHKQLSESGESVYTSFVLDDPSGEVTVGTYAVVVVVKDRRTMVPCVPSDSLKKESDGYYAYLFNGTDTSYVPVQIGMRDGMYTEILSGLSVGDKVLSASAPKNGKKTATVTKGDYSVEAEIGGFLYYPYAEWITNPSEYGKAYLKEFLVSENEKVVKDQVLATIEVVPESLEIERLTRQISRLQSRLVTLKEKKAKVDAKNETDRNLERQIAENEKATNQYQRSLDKLTKYSGIVEIKAPYDGIIMRRADIKQGDLLGTDAYIIEMANDSLSYVIVQDNKNQLNYGNEAEIRVSSSNGASTIKGKVVSVNKMCLSKKLTNDFSLVAIPQEELASIAGSTLVEGGRWDRNSFKVKVNVRSEKDVLIVPKAAVTLKEKSTYVTVLKEDGSVENVSFIPGGSDNNYYWIVDGLTEGMTVCWE